MICIPIKNQGRCLKSAHDEDMTERIEKEEFITLSISPSEIPVKYVLQMKLFFVYVVYDVLHEKKV